VGYSLGAALGLNLAADLGDRPLGNWRQLVAVCPPVDLFAVEAYLQRRVSRNYDLYFTRRLWQTTLDRAERVDGAPQVAHIQRPRRLREFDERVTAPLAGFASADDYYNTTSVASRLAQITMPTLIIAAANDPIVPVGPLRQARIGPRTEVVVTSSGGHMGYVGRRKGDPDRRWSDWRILEWLASLDTNPNDGQYAEAAATELANS
jgi:predicted alpha/beta-fold hydrolase